MRFFNGVSSLPHFCLDGNVDDLLDDVTGLVGFCLVPESDELSENVSNESFEDDEDEESDKSQYISVPYGHVLVPSLYHYNAIRLPILP